MEILLDNETYNAQNNAFLADLPDYTRYLKGKYHNNLARCKSRLIDPLISEMEKRGLNNNIPTIELVEQYWKYVKPYSYVDAFNIENNQFRALVFSSISIRDMINNLGCEKIKVEGIKLVNKVYNEYTESFSEKEYDYIAELYSVNGEKIGIRNSPLYVVKVWCTSTNEEHWLWVNENNCDINSPLDAIASTCIVYKSMIGNIKHIIRQGDVFLFEMKDNIKLNREDEKVRLSKDMYYSLLKSQA